MQEGDNIILIIMLTFYWRIIFFKLICMLAKSSPFQVQHFPILISLTKSRNLHDNNHIKKHNVVHIFNAGGDQQLWIKLLGMSTLETALYADGIRFATVFGLVNHSSIHFEQINTNSADGIDLDGHAHMDCCLSRVCHHQHIVWKRPTDRDKM